MNLLLLEKNKLKTIFWPTIEQMSNICQMREDGLISHQGAKIIIQEIVKDRKKRLEKFIQKNIQTRA
jgi:hypothetical protein